jgi:hypothetical protein
MIRTLTLALLSIAGALPVARACEGDKVKVTIVVILATETEGPIDGRLTAIAAEVQKLNPKLKSFHVKEMISKSLDEEEKASFSLLDGKTAEVCVKRSADKENRVVLAVTAPRQGEIIYRTVCGKFLPIVTRCHTQGEPRQRLILAIRVQPCQGD